MIVNIYMESSIKGPAIKNGIVGYVLQAGNTDATKTIFGTVKDITANQSILICLKNALSHIKSECEEVIIHTDNNYMYLNCSVSRQIQWLESGYRTSKGEEVKFAQEWRAIHSSLSGMKYQVIYKEPNEYKSWLKSEVERRAAKHGW